MAERLHDAGYEQRICRGTVKEQLAILRLSTIEVLKTGAWKYKSTVPSIVFRSSGQ